MKRFLEVVTAKNIWKSRWLNGAFNETYTTGNLYLPSLRTEIMINM